MSLQEEFCKSKGYIMFAPKNLICWGCKKPIKDSGTELITGCDRCNRSFVE